MNNKNICPCSSEEPYSSCCEPCISGSRTAATAEALMRSRYTAYVLKDEQYLLKTWHSSTRPNRIAYESMSGWCNLAILRTEAGTDKDTDGVVEFKATAISDKKIICLHEISSFVKEDGKWLYLDGDIQEYKPVTMEKVGRNHPCPCGSGRKFKKCCSVSS